jgi:hypothetical protein
MSQRITLCALVAAALLPQPLAAQEPVDHAMIARIRAEGLERSRVNALFDHLSNVIGPRLTASPAYLRSAEWARDRLREWGLEQARLEPFEFGRGWTLEQLTIELTAPRYFPVIGYPEAWTPSTRGQLEGEPLYVGDKSAAEIEALGERLRGAIVLATQPQAAFIESDRPQPADAQERVRTGAPGSVRARSEAPAQEVNRLLRAHGAGVVLRPNQGEHGTIFVLGSRNTPDDAVPAVVLAAEHYNMIARMVMAGEPVRMRVQVATRYHTADTNGYNVIAEIPGTDPALSAQVVLAGAHLDSWHAATGATDNADGVAAALEAVRILKAVGARPRRTIRIALWGGEEQGLLGSRAYAQQHLAGDANAAARENLYVYFNDDPGTGKTYGFYLEQNAALAPIFDAWLAPFRDLGAKRNVIDGIGSTDHVTFTRAGMPGFTAIKDYVDYDVRTHHTNTDFFERVNEEDLKQSAVVLASFLYHAAMREAPLPRPAAN